MYYAQSLYKAGAYPEATKASFVLDNPSSHAKVCSNSSTGNTRVIMGPFLVNIMYISRVLCPTQMVKLQACIKYCEEDYSASKVMISHVFC